MAGQRTPRRLDAAVLWDYALRVLGDRAHSSSELRRKLARRAALPSDVTAVMTKLREYGMADDQKFSESFATARLANTGMGRFRVLRDLRAKNVSATVAEKAVAAAFEGTDEDALAENFLLRKYRGKDLPVFLAEEKNLASAYRRLRTGGFSSAASLKVLKRYSQRAAEMDPVEAVEGEEEL
jgi:regulatory protein